MKDLKTRALESHKKWRGKIQIESTVEINNIDDLSLAYTPGVAEPCKEIHKNKDLVYEYCKKWNLVAVVTDGSAVLGLGNIGPEAAMPVMEGKCILFKNFGNVDAFPLCLNTQNVDEIVRTIEYLEPTFGGINLEDISAPRCFEIEKKLKEKMSIPIFHDDQHGTAIVTLAALLNSLKIVDKTIEEISVVINGAGAAGIAITKLLISCGVKDIILCDRLGAIFRGRNGLDESKEEISKITNFDLKSGTLSEIIVDRDVFIGVSTAGVLTKDMVSSMKADSIIFAMANPEPEIDPKDAILAGARVVGTGRSDAPNQINNVLAFPGVFRGALDVRARDINDLMKIEAAKAIASLISDDELSQDYIIPNPLDNRVVYVVSEAVKKAAISSGVNRM